MKCDTCNKLATNNFQLIWINWKIDKNGNYSNEHELLDGDSADSRHYCNKHTEDFENGDL